MAETQPSTEDWNSYRKLVISALERLEVCAEKMHSVINDLSTRASVSEREYNALKSDLSEAEKEIEQFKELLNKISASYVTKEEFQALKSQVKSNNLRISAILGTIVMIVTTAASALFQWVFNRQ